MEEQRNISDILARIPQPGFLVKENRIIAANQAASAMLLIPGQEFLPLISAGKEEYPLFQNGQLCLTLSVAGQPHPAVVTRLEDCDLILLDLPEEWEEFRSMALAAMELRKPLMQAISSARQLPADPKMNQSLMQMLRMVSNMSDISRYTVSSRMETRDVDSFLLELFEKAGTLTEGRAVIQFEGLKQPVFSLIDPEQLERAVWNILSNSLKFLPAQGKIHAKLTRKGNRLQLSVQDNGSGIAESVRSDLFHRYLRQPGIEDSRYGFGLGLTLVRTVAANHGGTVLISSKDGGTLISMTLPIRQDDSHILRCPLLRPDYTGGWDHALVELADCLPSEYYTEL